MDYQSNIRVTTRSSSSLSPLSIVITTAWVYFVSLCLLGNVLFVHGQAVQQQPFYRIAGIFDLDNLPWAQEVWTFTFQSLNQPWLHQLVPELGQVMSQNSALRELSADPDVSPGQPSHRPLQNAKCDSTTAVREYWSLREINGGIPPSAVVGTYCSGSTISVARIAGLESVPVISPFSTSSQLSDKDEFPYFSRLLAPDDQRGEVAALVSALDMFGWDRISIIATDTQYAQDWEREFRSIWSSAFINGEVAYSNTIRTTPEGTIDEESARTVLNEIPTDDPRINSRIILLLAHAQDAVPILRMAREMRVQPDTIWAGPSSWVGSDVVRDDVSGVEYPGYLGAVPFQNENGEVHTTFLSRIKASGSFFYSTFPAFAPQLIDAILATVIALGQSSSPTTSNVRFNGTSGVVEFTESGDLKDPKYTISLLESGAWTSVGTTGTQIGSARRTVPFVPLCFPEAGCVMNILKVPDDSYPVPPAKLPIWAIVIIVVVVVLLVGVAFKYWRSHRSKNNLKVEFKAFQESIVGMRTAQVVYIPTLSSAITSPSKLDGDVEQALPGGKDGRTSLSVKPQVKVVWCWQETSSMMNNHEKEMIEGDPKDCWIKYNDECNEKLEAAFQKGSKTCKPLSGYVVNFASMTQTKKASGFERAIKRVVLDPLSSSVTSSTVASSLTTQQQYERLKPRQVDLTKARFGTSMPDDIRNEPQMVLVEGDIVQVSKHHEGGWAFGTKLHHHDEAMAREIVSYANSASSPNGSPDLINDEGLILADTGWFPLDATSLPSSDDLKTLEQTVGGDTSALEAPLHWDPVKDPSIVQLHRLKQGDPERTAVLDAFRSTMSKRKISSIKVDRIQNLAMWQSYIVKRRTICIRDINQENKQRKKKKKDDTDKTDATSETEQMNNAVKRKERCWLWHGTNAEVKDKIIQQGFNRSFCGKNATMYGKGVYYARDASYSSYKTYAVPDSDGVQYILACRVVVGEYCVGVKDALTPNVRDVKTQTLYDSTVGLLSDDTMDDPSIYVTYHDAQAYPEYLISFKQT